MEILKQYINAVSPLKNETWETVKQLFTETKLNKGDYFIEEGPVAKQIAFLYEGVVRAFFRSNEGIEYNKTFFTAPFMFGGYSSLITAKPNLINQQALTDCKLLVADYTLLCKLYNSHPDLERVARKLAELFFVIKEKREIEIVLLNADKRYQIFKEEHPGLEQLIPQYHIASYLGITPTQLSRIRSEAKKK